LTDSVGISKARAAAEQIISTDPELKNYPELSLKINQLEKIYIKD